MSSVIQSLKNYNQQMSISQIILFFERHEMVFTKTMIQNYVRIGLLLEPDNKRYYNKKHIILLTWIHLLKDFYSLDEIKKLFMMVAYNDSVLIAQYEEFILIRENLTSAIIELLPTDKFAALSRLSLSKKIASALF